MKMGKSLLIVVSLLLLGFTTAAALEGALAEEFAFLSNQTRQAMELPASELEGLVTRCDGLLEKTDKLKGAEKKIMRKKIEKLRGLFLYVVNSKNLTQEAVPEK